MTGEQQFWVAVLTQVGPWVLAALGILATYLKAREANRRIERLQISVDGRLSQLLEEKDARVAVAEKAAARAAGEAEGLKAAVSTPTVIPVMPPVGEPKPFGRRATDKPPEPEGPEC